MMKMEVVLMSHGGYLVWFIVTTVCVVALLGGGVAMAVRAVQPKKDS